MSDILTRLRCTVPCQTEDGCHCAEARAEITRLRAMVTPKPLDDAAPKDRVLIGVERPPYEDETYYYMVEWREDKQEWMTECGFDFDTGEHRYAFCGVSHYLDPLELPGLPYWEGKDEDEDEDNG